MSKRNIKKLIEMKAKGKKKKKKVVEDEKYTLDTPILTLREALIQDGIRNHVAEFVWMALRYRL